MTDLPQIPERAGDALTVACPLCRAAPGEGCRNLFSDEPATPHIGRAVEAEAAKLSRPTAATDGEADALARWKAGEPCPHCDDSGYVTPSHDVCECPCGDDVMRQLAAMPAPASSPSDGETVMIPRNPTDAMMDAGLYHCSHDMTAADLFTAWQAMFDTVTLDGGMTESARADRAMRAFGASDAACYLYPGADQEKERAAFCAGAAHSAAMPAPASSSGVLPCDVKLPPATIIRAGCSLETLMVAMDVPHRPKHFERPSGPKMTLDELRDTLTPQPEAPASSSGVAGRGDEGSRGISDNALRDEVSRACRFVGSVAAWCRARGLHEEPIGAFLRGKRPPPKALLDQMEIEPVTIYRQKGLAR